LVLVVRLAGGSVTDDPPARRVLRAKTSEVHARRDLAKQLLDYDLETDGSPYWTEVPHDEKTAAEEAIPDALLADAVDDRAGDWTAVSTIADGNPYHDAPPVGVFEPDLSPLPTPTVESHHDGLVFENELYDMTAAAKPLLMELLGGDAVIKEMPYGDKFRTDLAICESDRGALQTRVSITGDARPLNEEWKFLEGHRYVRSNQPLTRREFLDGRTPYVESTSKTVWNWLRDQNLIASNETGYCTAVDYPIHITAHAVELKPRDWQTALGQAARATRPVSYIDKYGYADYRWVVMDAGSVDDALRHARHFRELGVGLISLDRGGAVKLIDAERQAPPERSLDREHLNEKTLQQIDVADFLSGYSPVSDGTGEDSQIDGESSGRMANLSEFTETA
jgi:hypothetical protein